MQPEFRASFLRTQRSPYVIDITLDTAVDRILEFQGDFVLMDMQSTGFADLEFNQRASPQLAPFRAYPGATVEGEFESVRVKAPVQPGKVLRLVLATGWRFKPGNAQGRTVDIVGANTELGAYSNGAVGANVGDLVTSTANLNGILLKFARIKCTAGAGGTVAPALIAYNPAVAAKNSAPGPGKIQLLGHYNDTTVATSVNEQFNRLIPPGWGLFVIESVTVAAASCNTICSFEVL